MNIETAFDAQSSLVRRLTKDPQIILDNLTPHMVNLWHASTGICTEAGELKDAVKKSVVYNKKFDLENAVEELGDLMFYIQQFAQGIGISLEEAMRKNVEKLNKRYPEGYTDAAGIERADKK